MDEGWQVGAGPNGGYVGAVILRALEDAVADPDRLCRSFTVHFLSPPAPGPVEIEVTVERSGRSMTSVSARLRQDGTVRATALAAFSRERPGPSFTDVTMPVVPDPESITDSLFADSLPASAVPEMARRYDQRRVMGPRPFSGGEEALIGGWIRLVEPRVIDAAQLVAYADAWMPAMFGRIGGPWGITTVDLTVHIRSLPELAADEWCLVEFRSVMSDGGFCEEDGFLWSRDGTLLAQSRQLAALLEVRSDVNGG